MLSIDEGLALLFLQPLALFVFAAIVWSMQSILTIHFSRRYIYPQFYKNALIEWFFAEVSIIVHEASHLLSAVFTGSSVDLRQSYVSPKGGRIAAVRSESIGGWISSTIAATAPSFLPPFLFAIIFVLLTQQAVSFNSLFTYPKTTQEIVQSFQNNATSVLLPALEKLSLLFDLSQPLTLLLIYIIIVFSIAAGPSEGDWRSTLDLLFSPVPAIALFGTFLLLNFLFAQFGIGFFVPLSLLIAYLFTIVALGMILAMIFASLLSVAYTNLLSAFVAIVLFAIVYASLFFYQLMPVLCFIAALLASMVYVKLVSRSSKHRTH